MKTDLQSEILIALEGTSSQRQMDTKTLIKKTRRQRARVEAALSAMYQERSVYCCKITKGGQERIVWWRAGQKQVAYFERKPATPATKRKVSRLSPLSIEVKDLVKSRPGLTMPELIATLSGKRYAAEKVRTALCNLRKCGHLLVEGASRNYRHYVGVKA